MTTRTNAIGAYGERTAARFLEERGYCILARNWRSPDGELDLITLDPEGTLAIIEVKTRTSQNFGHPFEAVTASKLLRLRRLTAAWLRDNPYRGQVRIDVVSVLLPRAGAPRVEHLEGVAA